MSEQTLTLCYLCGKPLQPGEPTNQDHLPAKSFFPSALRAQFSPQLKTVISHQSCNTDIAKDEEYFVASIGPLAIETVAGKALADDLRKKYQDERRRRLGQMAVEEFGKIVGPGGERLKAYNHKRVARVMWKIVRGLSFVETGIVLDPNAPKKVGLYPTPEEIRRSLEPEGWFSLVRDTQPMGAYGGVFDYKALGLRFIDDPGSYQVWALCFWDRVLATVMFHNPWCRCEGCVESRLAQASPSS